MDFASLGEPLGPRVLSTLARTDLLVVRGFGLDTEPLIQTLEREGLSVIGTRFGRIEDLRTDNTTNQNMDQLSHAWAGPKPQEASPPPEAATKAGAKKERTPRVDWAGLLCRTFALDFFAPVLQVGSKCWRARRNHRRSVSLPPSTQFPFRV